ncbi:MAG: LCP family protein [Lachnospiraceae bacterium]|nr:LCP family protein [Lachnospiraceae bacterium]
MLEDKVITEKKKRSAGGVMVLTLLMIAFIIFGIFIVLKTIGGRSLHKPVEGLETSHVIVSESLAGNAGISGLADGHVTMDGVEYIPNADLICILVMGIDKETALEIGGQSWTAEEGSNNTGGQADALFLLLLNPHDETVRVVGINRNSMAEVDVWDKEGNYKGLFTQQIALQHGYGSDQAECAQHQVRAVSRMFYNIPIHAYAAVSMDSIPELNDAVGGVTVEVLDDIIYPEYEMDLHQGDTVTLMGEKAYWYVRLRNENVFNSNALRLERQKQYLTCFAARARECVNGDVNAAVELFQLLQKYMVTDLNLSSYTYLISETMEYEFDADYLYTVPGETVMGNDFEEYYVDDEALQRLIVDLFYEPVTSY